MTLYIEYVIIDNMVMNYVIIKLLSITTGQKFKKICVFLSCAMGTIFAILLPYIYGFKMLVLLYRIISSIIMVLTLKKYKSFKNFLTYYSLFFAYTFIMGGAVLWLIQMLEIEYTSSSILMYNFDFPLGIFAIILVLLIKVIFKVVLLLKRRLAGSNYIHMITIKDGGQVVKTTAFLDTGNNICVDGSGVNVISIDLFLKLHKDIKYGDVCFKTKACEKLNSIKYITVGGIGSGQKYLSYIVDNMTVDGTTYTDIRFAVALKNFDDYECILHKEFVKGGRV